MSATTILTVILLYFSVLFLIAWFTSRNADDTAFFTANRNSPWYLVAFGMIGATISGVTFISVPGAVGPGKWAYMQLVMGYTVGYAVIALVLMPLYYRMNLVSIYTYLRSRYGNRAYKSGATLFLLARTLGAGLRMYLAVIVLQLAVFDQLSVPFEATVLIAIVLIYLYTFKGGIKTIVYTDTMQTTFLILGAVLTLILISRHLHLDFPGLVTTVYQSDYSDTFVWDWAPGTNFFKQFISGAFIAIAMTGLDQDMMQKNLTCRTLKDAQKNMLWFTITLVFVNLMFLSLGVLLYEFSEAENLIEIQTSPKWAMLFRHNPAGELIATQTDKIFPLISFNYLAPIAGLFFILGIIAATYASSDSALTSLTTSFCLDILDYQEKKHLQAKGWVRNTVHLSFCVLLGLIILAFRYMNNDAVINQLFVLAGYTYGPLLGLYALGMYSRLQIRDLWIPWICMVSPILTYFIQYGIKSYTGYDFGFMVLLLNAGLTMLLLWIARK